MNDYCEHCGEPIYPDDECIDVCSVLYHVECADILGLGYDDE